MFELLTTEDSRKYFLNHNSFHKVDRNHIIFEADKNIPFRTILEDPTLTLINKLQLLAMCSPQSKARPMVQTILERTCIPPGTDFAEELREIIRLTVIERRAEEAVKLLSGLCGDDCKIELLPKSEYLGFIGILAGDLDAIFFLANIPFDKSAYGLTEKAMLLTIT